MLKLSLIIALMLTSACSQFVTREEIQRMESQKSEVKIDSSQEKQTLTLDDDVLMNVDNKAKKTDKIGHQNYVNIFLEDSGLEPLVGVGYLAQLEKKQIQVSRIEGKGLGKLVAQLYQKYKKASVVEWHLFKLFNNELPFKPGNEKNLRKKTEIFVDTIFSDHDDRLKIKEEVMKAFNNIKNSDFFCHLFFEQINFHELLCLLPDNRHARSYRRNFQSEFILKPYIEDSAEGDLSQYTFADYIFLGKATRLDQ